MRKQTATLVGTMNTNVFQNHGRRTPQYLYFVHHLHNTHFDNLLNTVNRHS